MSSLEAQPSSVSVNSLLEVPELVLVEHKLYELVNRSNGVIKEACSSLVFSGGKRIRPLLTVTSGMCFGPLNTLTINAAVASELIHMASLIHDDVIDGASTRRGIPSINSTQGNLVAVLTGDYIFAEAFNILCSNQLLISMRYLVQAIQAMCEGEVNQAGERFSTSSTTEDYFKRIANKTGILLSSCCKSGAATAGATEEQIMLLGQYGLHLGYTYQIIDDILDFTGDSEVIGKPTCLDLMNGNITLPLIYLLESPDADWVKYQIDSKKITPEGVVKIRDFIIKSGCIERSYNTALECIASAKSSLKNLPNNQYKDRLLGLADRMVIRIK